MSPDVGLRRTSINQLFCEHSSTNNDKSDPWVINKFIKHSAMTDFPRLGLEGRHQLENAGLALTTAAVLKTSAGFDRLSLDTIAKGFHSTWLPGRFQRCTITGDDPKSPLVILDGAHTPEAARYIVEAVRATVSKDCPVAIILAVAADKDIG